MFSSSTWTQVKDRYAFGCTCTYSAPLQVLSACFWWVFCVWGRWATAAAARIQSETQGQSSVSTETIPAWRPQTPMRNESRVLQWTTFSTETKAGLVWICVRGNRMSRTGNPSSGCFSNRSPKISSQYLAILYCCGLLQQTHTRSCERRRTCGQTRQRGIQSHRRTRALTLTDCKHATRFTCSGSQTTE